MVTLLRTWVMSSAAMTLSLSSPIAWTARSRSLRGLVEGDFVIGQAEVFAALGGGVHFLGQLDEFLDHLLRGDGAVVVGVEGLIEFSEKSWLCTRLRFERTLSSSLSSFSSNSAATFLCLRPRTSARSWSLKMLMSGFGRPAAVNTSMICPSVVIALETSCRIAASICSDDLHEALFPVVLLKHVLLPGGNESEPFARRAGRPFLPAKAVQHVAGDAVLLQHHGDAGRRARCRFTTGT